MRVSILTAICIPWRFEVSVFLVIIFGGNNILQVVRAFTNVQSQLSTYRWDILFLTLICLVLLFPFIFGQEICKLVLFYTQKNLTLCHILNQNSKCVQNDFVSLFILHNQVSLSLKTHKLSKIKGQWNFKSCNPGL